MMPKSVVILRPLDDSAELVSVVEGHGLTALVEPILSIEYLEADYSTVEEDTPLIFTSSNGVRAFCAGTDRRNHPVYTVGRNTADEARQKGFTRIETAAGTAEDMIALFTGPLKTALKTPLYVRGKDVSSDLKQVFGKKDLKIDEIVGYKANPAQNLSIDLLKQADKGKISAIMFFSIRGARNFSSLIQQYDRIRAMKTIKALCIGQPVVNCLSVLPFQEVVVADNPDRYGMVKLLEQHL